MIAVIVPIHNEEELLSQCLASLAIAQSHPLVRERGCRVIVVLDACTDRSRDIASTFDVTIVETAVRCVGAARAIGARLAIDTGAEWLAFTDGDTCVDAQWLASQLSLGADAVCGTVEVDWPAVRTRAQIDHESRYRDVDGHSHIHGANLGISAAAYLEVGGFAALESNEDVTLVEALMSHGKRIAWSAVPRVVTSARTVGRVPLGFAVGLSRFDDHRAAA